MLPEDTDAGSDPIARGFFLSSIIWLVIGVSLGAFLSLQFVYPDLTRSPYLQFGRLRPLHVTMMLYGWLSMTYMGAIFYSTTSLAKSKLYSQRLGWLALAMWNILLISASITLPLGMNQGREYAELIYPLDVLFVLGLATVFWNIYRTVAQGQEKRIYVSLWHFLAALPYTMVIYALGNAMWSIPSGALFGFASFVSFAFLYHALPKLLGSELRSRLLSEVHFWFTLLGMLGMALSLWVAGYTRGTMGRRYDRGGSSESHGRGHGRPDQPGRPSDPGRGNPPDSPPGNPNPGQPENPGNPGNPDNPPENPGQPDNPEQPGNPNPGPPDNPGQPDNPNNPDQPNPNPGNPGNPDNPPENPGNPNPGPPDNPRQFKPAGQSAW